jgi:hypothetical protein
VDLVGFVRLLTYTKGEDGDRKKAISTGELEVICHATAENVSKNRFGITEQLPYVLGSNPLAAVIPSLGAPFRPATVSQKMADAETTEGTE